MQCYLCVHVSCLQPKQKLGKKLCVYYAIHQSVHSICAHVYNIIYFIILLYKCVVYLFLEVLCNTKWLHTYSVSTVYACMRV